jgi:TIR domain/SIR2-like domain
MSTELSPKVLKTRANRLWQQIIDFIQDGEVIPIVGQELLSYQRTPHAQTCNLYDELARQFADDFHLDHIPQPTAKDLGPLFASHPDFHGNGSKPYEELKFIYKDIDAPVPESLRKLAQIDELRIFISTTFDDLLERALNEERFAGEPLTKVISYWLKRVPSEAATDAALRSGLPVVFKLFGSIDRPLDGYAVTESDYVEFMHNLQSRERRPERMFAELEDKHILLLGNSLPDWLARFFLRLTRHQPLWSEGGRTKQYLADSIFQNDPFIQFFLLRCTKMAEILPDLSAIEAVDYLRSCWQRAKPRKPALIPAHDQPLVSPPKIDSRLGTEATIEENRPIRSDRDPDEMLDGAIFVSYARTSPDGSPSPDAAFAQRLKRELENEGLDVWLDTHGGLLAGDHWENRIRRNVNRCILFLPCLSRTTEARPEGFFRREWDWAIRRNSTFTGSNRPFIIPVALGVPIRGMNNLPEEFRNLQVEQVIDGIVAPEFCSRIKALVRSARKNQRSGL